MTALPPPGSSERASWRQTLRAAFLERLGLKAISIVIALLLWLVVKARQPVQDYVPVVVMPTLDSSLVLLETPPQLKALVSGRAVDILRLHVDPLVIHRIIDADVPDTLVLDVTPADVGVPADLVDRAHVLDVQPRSVALRFGTKATKRVPVIVGLDRVVIRADSLYDSFSILAEPTSVRITGPRRLVRRIKDMRPHSLTITSVDSAYYADLDTSGLGVRVLPTRVRVSIKCGGAMEGGSGRPCPP
jgi:hypothetical protein